VENPLSVTEFKVIRFEDGGLLPTTLTDGNVCELEVQKVELDIEVESDIADCICILNKIKEAWVM
jgi:hypothetical protein